MPITMAESEADWSTSTTPKSPAASVTVQAGDYITIGGVTADQTTILNTPSGGGLTYVQQGTVNMGSNCWISIWTALCSTTQTFTLSCSRSATSNIWGYNGLVLTGSSGVGATQTGNGTGAASVAITPQQASSALVWFLGDWNAADGGSRSYRTNAGTFTEQSYFRDSAQYTIYGGAHLNAGVPSSMALGFTAPTGTKYVMSIAEMKASSIPFIARPILFVPQAIRRASCY